MKALLPFLLFVLCSQILSCQTTPVHGVNRAENFKLQDIYGYNHELYALKSSKLIVIVGHTEGCPILEKSYVKLMELKRHFSNRGVAFLFLNSSSQDDPKSLQESAKLFGHDIPILKDEARAATHQLRITRSAEAVVIVPGKWQIAYRGPIDDQYDYQSEKFENLNRYLQEGLEALLNGKSIEIPEREAKGCLLSLSTQKSLRVSWGG